MAKRSWYKRSYDVFRLGRLIASPIELLFIALTLGVFGAFVWSVTHIILDWPPDWREVRVGFGIVLMYSLGYQQGIRYERDQRIRALRDGEG